ncbi:PepSY-associated TM helix domain-containing protein [Thalassolituus sp. LLYu03]|uniref:PepSY-associated TM helix domain-containing protein n=1 Tax=Thalassolituus sp. LLYu03 TaxID=3421656 RepID=UPI003D267A54
MTVNSTHALQLKLWRWHFYAGLFVLPFMLVLALTGLAMLLNPQLEQWQFGQWLTVTHPDAQQPLPASEQLAAVVQAFPAATAEQYLPPTHDHGSARVHVRDAGGSRIVFADPYTAQVLGSIALHDTWYAIADDIHGSLLTGWFGDALLEAAAGLCIFLLISGVYLHWPRTASGSLWRLPLSLNKRFHWRQLHGALGLWLSLILVFFALSGLAWTGVWGQKIVQPWSSFPAEKSPRFWLNREATDPHAGHHQSTSEATPALTTASLNSDNLNEVPWAVELQPLPHSAGHHDHSAPHTQAFDLDAALAKGKALGMDYFRVSLPRGKNGVYSLIASTTSGDISNPLHDRTVHLDRFSGAVLADIGWTDYNLLAKSMAAGIALHKGLAGPLNLWANIVACVLLMLLSLAGLVLWFKRRPQRKSSPRHALSRPPRAPAAAAMPLMWRLTFIGCAVLFPLSGVALLLFAACDWLIDTLKVRATKVRATTDH